MYFYVLKYDDLLLGVDPAFHRKFRCCQQPSIFKVKSISIWKLSKLWLLVVVKLLYIDACPSVRNGIGEIYFSHSTKDIYNKDTF